MSVTLDKSFLDAMLTMYTAKLGTFPAFAGPSGVSAPTPLFHIGRYQQADVETRSLIITLHMGDPQEEASSGERTWRHEHLPRQDEFGVAGYAASVWKYRYSVYVQYFLTRVRVAQQDALTNIYRVLNWLRLQAQRNPVHVLHGYGLVQQSDFGETMLRYYPVAIEIIEGGGPPRDYIMRGKLFLEADVHITPQ